MFRDVKYSALAGDAEDDDDNSMTLASRRQYNDENIITRTLQPGDSLQSISLQYYVPVSKIKINQMLEYTNTIFVQPGCGIKKAEQHSARQ